MSKVVTQPLQAGAVALDKFRTVRHTFMRRLRGPTLLSFGHATEGGVAGAGSDGVITIGAGGLRRLRLLHPLWPPGNDLQF